MLTYTAEDFPAAVMNLFSMNNYECESNIKIRSAQIDVVAKAKGDPFAPKVYMEITISYVDNDKYSKDLTKFVVARTIDPGCVCLSVSMKGFTADVKERASASNIRTQTYEELFRSFERFAPYIEKITQDAPLRKFIDEYEEPFFDDDAGKHKATDWLSNWAADLENKNNWIIILGEYGTGKTALTKRIQSSLIDAYLTGDDQPLPIRIELRDFTRQFDARTLLHNFLDRNGMSHVSIDFVFYLIRQRKVVLILDGYDEMAQFLNVRERRACLSALADLAAEGAKGLLTSRPNYFSEEEEMQVFEALYRNLHVGNYYVNENDQRYLDNELKVDKLLSRYIDQKYERYLRDLDNAQTISLVNRKLSNNPAGQKVVISILNRVFREREGEENTSLSGKPVIITYMFDLVENMDGKLQIGPEELTEWSIYKLIVDQLMLRDQQRTPGILPTKRRLCLHRLAITLSQRDTPTALDVQFLDIIAIEFRVEFRQLDSDQIVIRRNEIFENLRSSSTLTRSESLNLSGWTFSHNSLREYLVAESYIAAIREARFPEITTPITSAMRAFVASIEQKEIEGIIRLLYAAWAQRGDRRALGGYMTLLWDAICVSSSRQNILTKKLLPHENGVLAFDSLKLKEITIGPGQGRDYDKSSFKDSDFGDHL